MGRTGSPESAGDHAVVAPRGEPEEEPAFSQTAGNGGRFKVLPVQMEAEHC